MKIVTLTAAAAALTAGVLGLAAPAAAAPSGGSAADTISQLEAQGNRVVVQRQGSASLDDAEVVSIQRGPVERQSIPFGTSNGDHTRSVTGQTIYVTVR
jgi:aspartate carbamoyltransferase catalytic subunit